ncbi:DUF4082 domain-containing protein [Lacisediminihabitans changchengi]|uniref:DUF4082 domain-containing protein n=1 Tax=Lacisediminihabitans changchengi TaxID=2787634 RepID=A0A934SMZ5_9MICO|nr:DUF4082 domain-containing protein [Lacisediminihabitans changchengi]MBK4348508.1 DUF4082 domain-containing protein [Lacisediminihabitans changchengi]
MIAAAVVVIALAVTGVGVFRAAEPASAAPSAVLYPDAVPKTLTDPDPKSVELGLQFSSSVGGTISGIRFYKSKENTGTHVGALWSSSGRRLASVTFTNESATGWQTANFATPVAIKKNRTYVASYLAPKGKYSVTENGFAKPYTSGTLTVPTGGGVYRYGTGGFPTYTYKNSNYFVDVVYTPSTVTVPSPSSSTTPTPSATPSTSPSSSPSPSPSPSPSTPPTTTPPPVSTALNLPRIPWEGGSDYWKKFRATDAAGWDDPSFFPIVIWYNGISNNAEAMYDKSVGINTYIGMDKSTPYSLFKDNGVFWIGDKLNSSFTDSSTNWVGNFLDDEVDGRYSPAAGRAHLQQLVDSYAGNGRFNYANFTQIVMSTDGNQSDAEQYVNNYTDAVSADMYWYTIPYCSWTPYRGDTYLNPITKANCRTSSSYGKTVNMLRQRDAVDGKLQPIWNFIEDLNGGPGPSAPAVTITPAQLKGSVMNSIINEARGIVYFNQSLSGSCQGGSILRQSQVTPNFCGAPQIAAAKEVDALIRQLAPVINTQSYQYSFGSGLNTMLKAYNGSAYIFSMVDGSSTPGSRTFTLPGGITGSQIEVVGENRTITVGANRTFTDSFAAESSYHIYKITV